MQFRNTDLLDDWKILLAIKEAPFEKTMSNLDKLGEEDRYKLAMVVVELENDTAKNKSG